MIKKIKTINSFAIFDGFDWNATIRDKGNNSVEFKKLNILYGRNYSGKTTLSRIIRSLEEKKLPDKYLDAKFEIEEDTQNIDHTNLAEHTLDVRVYNSDFVNDNLSFLTDEEGEIKSFAILGEENIKIEEQITKKESELGSEAKKTGLIYKLLQKKGELEKKQIEKQAEETDLEAKLKNKANQDIKRNSIYKNVTYNINNIKQDINTILDKPILLLADRQIDEKKSLLKEDPKLDITKLNIFDSTLETHYEQTCKLIEKEIRPTESIQALLNDALLQEWVRSGILHHKNKRKTCAFCGNTLSKDLWTKLDAHFNKESEELREALKKQVLIIEKSKIKNQDLIQLEISNFYTVNQSNFVESNKLLENEIIKYNNTLDILIKEIEAREIDIFNARQKPTIENNSDKINRQITALNTLIKDNNSKTSSLNSEQEKARRELRLNEIAKFVEDIDYQKKVEKIKNLNEEVDLLLEESIKMQANVDSINKDIANLRILLKDERKGADKINNYLNHFFGNDSIKFEAIEIENEPRFTFQIKRGNEIAYKLSEGECSLVAFCYFIAKLEDIETKNKDLIIWIDDPISSLDNNHVFFVFSLIESIIAKPYKNSDNTNGYNYEQLFISTHNIDFLKYLKKLSKPKKQKKDDVLYFLLERQGQQSKLLLMPEYLIKYTTEFNYLFHQIYKCATINPSDVIYDVFYNFGNNLRKFLEAYLFYKYPSNTSIIVKLKKFFIDDTAVALVYRVDNELSHLEEIFDRSMKPIDIPEIPKLALYVLNKIKEKDPDQYDALLKSIGER